MVTRTKMMEVVVRSMDHFQTFQIHGLGMWRIREVSIGYLYSQHKRWHHHSLKYRTLESPSVCSVAGVGDRKSLILKYLCEVIMYLSLRSL